MSSASLASTSSTAAGVSASRAASVWAQTVANDPVASCFYVAPKDTRLNQNRTLQTLLAPPRAHSAAGGGHGLVEVLQGTITPNLRPHAPSHMFATRRS
jgi:hypothetical protein